MSIGQTKNRTLRYSGDKDLFFVLVPCLLLCVVIALVVMFTEYQPSEDQPPEVKTINIPGEGISTPEITVALELDWGNGDYQVGYADDFVINNVQKGTCVGPSYFTVDNDENIYLKDTANRRFLKYDSSGQFVGEVSIDRFDSDRGGLMLADYGYLYVITENSVLYRYSFEDDELISIKVHRGGIESDGIGNIYVIDEEDHVSTLYKVDSSLTDVQETREHYWSFAHGYGQTIDSEGNIYYLDGSDEKATDRADMAIYRFTRKGTIEKLYEIPCAEYKTLGCVKLLKILSSGDIFLLYSPFMEKVICRINGEGEVMEQFAIPQGAHSALMLVAQNESVYLLIPRRYAGDDESPFRLYKVEADE